MPKVLVVNRGEIAIRILRAALELDWNTVAIYTENDESHTTFANEAVKLNNVSEYLDVQRIVEIAVQTQCTHLHPGYGFLSENLALALALPASIVFIGPSPDTLRISSDKMLSRNLARTLGIRVAPGKGVESANLVRDFAWAEGYPVMIKALDGGGGRGIRLVESESGIEEAFKRCLGESPSRRVFAEKALTGPSWIHIEIQIVGDGGGAVNHFWERECSVQRRFQKIIELAPSSLSRHVIKPLLDSSLRMARHLNYKGLGTFEYLVNSESHEWVFLEINPRVQVEHTITEEIMGIDLVRIQLLLFTPSTTLGSLLLSQPPDLPTAHAVQLRLTAEDSSQSFRLVPGAIKSSDIIWPSGRGVRVDTWLSIGPFSEDTISQWTVGTEFDSLLAKVIVRGSNFEDMSQKAICAMKELKLNSEVNTNLDLLMGVLYHPDWLVRRIDTLWLERNLGAILDIGKSKLYARHLTDLPRNSNRRARSTRNVSSSGATLLQPGTLFHLTLKPTSADANVKKHMLTLSNIAHNGFPGMLSGTLETSLSPTPLQFSLSQSSSAAATSSSYELADPNNEAHIISPFAGKIDYLHSALLAAKDGGDENHRRVKRGETLITMSVMKIEHGINSPHDGTVERLGKGVKVGAILGEGMLICVLNFSTNSIASRL